MLSSLLFPNVQAGTEMLNFLQKSLVRAEAKTQTLFHHSQFSSFTTQKADERFNVIAVLWTTVILLCRAGRRDLVGRMLLTVTDLLQSLREEAHADSSGPQAVSGPPALES